MNTSDALHQATLLLIAFGGVVAINLVLLVVYLVRQARGLPPLFAPRWSVSDLWWGAQIIMGLLVVVLIPLMGVAFALGVKGDDLTNFASVRNIRYVILPSSLLQNAVFFAVVAGFVTLKYRLPLRVIGLFRWPRRRDIVAGLLLGFVGMGLSALVEIAVQAAVGPFHDVPWVKAAMNTDKTNAVAMMTHTLHKMGVSGLILAVLGIGIAPPLGEEMVFRGFAFNCLRRRFGMATGLIGSALLFTLPHGYGLGLVPVFALGLFMAWVYKNTGSLWVPILIHAVNNTTQVLLVYYFPALMNN